MGKKLVTKPNRVARTGNEGPKALGGSPQAIPALSLEGELDRPDWGFALYQVKGGLETRRIPDLILKCKLRIRWAIEIALTGREWSQNLEVVRRNVVKVTRGHALDFE